MNRMVLLAMALFAALVVAGCGRSESSDPLHFLQSTAAEPHLVNMEVTPERNTYGPTIYGFNPITDEIFVYTRVVTNVEDELIETTTQYSQTVTDESGRFDVVTDLRPFTDRIVSVTVTVCAYRNGKLADKVVNTVMFNYPTD